MRNERGQVTFLGENKGQQWHIWGYEGTSGFQGINKVVEIRLFDLVVEIAVLALLP